MIQGNCNQSVLLNIDWYCRIFAVFSHIPSLVNSLILRYFLLYFILQVFIWRESSPSLKKVQFLIKRQFWVVDYVLTLTSMAVVTDCGEVFVCSLSAKAPPVKEPIKSIKGILKIIKDICLLVYMIKISSSDLLI